MRSFKARRPSPAVVISVIALFAAIGGVAGALPGKNTVGSGDIKKNAVRSSDIKNNRVRGKDVKESSLATVPRAGFAAQAAGPTAFARLDNPAASVDPGPGVIEADSRGVSDANFRESQFTGIYCIHDFPGLRSASAVGDVGNPNNEDNDILVTFSLGDPFGDCSPGANGVVYVFDASSGLASNSGFYIQLYR